MSDAAALHGLVVGAEARAALELLHHALAGARERQLEREDLLHEISLAHRELAQRDPPRHGVAQLTHVPRPPVVLEARERCARVERSSSPGAFATPGA